MQQCGHQKKGEIPAHPQYISDIRSTGLAPTPSKLVYIFLNNSVVQLDKFSNFQPHFGKKNC